MTEVWRARYFALQSAASCEKDRDCEHLSITGGICDTCHAYITAVNLDDTGTKEYICDYQRLEAELIAAERNNCYLSEELQNARNTIEALKEKHEEER